jgi:hypothetical protein
VVGLYSTDSYNAGDNLDFMHPSQDLYIYYSSVADLAGYTYRYPGKPRCCLDRKGISKGVVTSTIVITTGRLNYYYLNY